MGLIHDQIAEKIALNLIQNKIFGNRYLATKLPIFPKPDIVLLGLSKEPQPQIAFEVKPPHSVKREYLTGLGQAISYLITFPLVYMVLPDETIDDLHIPTFIKEIIEKSDLKIGLISYDINKYEPKILKEAILEEKIDIEKLEKKITSMRPRSWLFWMDTKLEEVGEMLNKINEVESRNIQGNIQYIVLNEFWEEKLRFRYPKTKRPSSFKLNYKLFLDTLNLWTGNGNLTVLGFRLYEIYKKYGWDSKEFKDALHYVILTEGGYLKMLILIDKLQHICEFSGKGTEEKLNKIIRKIRENLKKEKDQIDEKEDVLPLYEKIPDNSWLKCIGVELFKMGFGRSLTQINVELSRRFGTYFQNYLQTDKGYSINWEKILSLIEKGNELLNLF